MSRQAGFTLIEMLVSLVLAAVVVAWLSGTLSHATRAWERQFRQTLARDADSRVLAQFVSDLRHFRLTVKPAVFSPQELIFAMLTREGTEVQVRYAISAGGMLTRATRAGEDGPWADEVELQAVTGTSFSFGTLADQAYPQWVAVDGMTAAIPPQMPLPTKAAP